MNVVVIVLLVIMIIACEVHSCVNTYCIRKLERTVTELVILDDAKDDRIDDLVLLMRKSQKSESCRPSVYTQKGDGFVVTVEHQPGATVDVQVHSAPKTTRRSRKPAPAPVQPMPNVISDGGTDGIIMAEYSGTQTHTAGDAASSGTLPNQDIPNHLL